MTIRRYRITRTENARKRSAGCSRLVGGESLETRRLLAFDPSPIEQAFMEDVNRMRMDPQGEWDVLLSSTNPLRARDPAVQGALDFFQVSGTLLRQQWNELEPTHPVAWNEDLIDAAYKHTIRMRDADEQSHQLPGEPGLGERIRAEGYTPLQRATENVYAFAESHIHGHAGFVIDWGEGPGGIQSPAGHRVNYMDPNVDEVGIAVVSENNNATEVGPLLTTQNFGRRGGYSPQILGVVYHDGNNNGIYDPGEGYNQMRVTVSGDGGTFTTRTMTAGGYQIEVPAGTYQVRVEGVPLPNALVVGNVTVGNRNVKVDFERDSANQPPIARNDSVTATEDSQATINVLANDAAPDGALVNNSVAIVSGPNNGTAEVLSNGRIVYTPNPDYSGSDRLQYTVRDTNSITSNVATVNISVGNVPDTPVASDVSRDVVEDSNGYVIPMTNHVTDADNNIDWSTLELITQPNQGSATINTSNRTFTYTPRADYVGLDRFDYRVMDHDGRFSNVATVTLNVTNINDRPIAVGETEVVIAGASRTYNVMNNDTDVDSNLANGFVQLLFGGVNGLSSVVGRTIQYTPNPGFVGREALRYRIGDGDGAFSDPVDLVIYSVSGDRPWQNPVLRTDVNGDGTTSPIDALTVINVLGESLTIPEDNPLLSGGPLPFVDIDGDNAVSPLDALFVINELTANALAASSVVATTNENVESDTPAGTSPIALGGSSLPTSSTTTRAAQQRLIDSIFEREE